MPKSPGAAEVPPAGASRRSGEKGQCEDARGATSRHLNLQYLGLPNQQSGHPNKAEPDILPPCPASSRLSNVASRPRFIATRVTRLHATVLKLSGGRLKRSFLFAGGQPVLALTTTGRKSGQKRSTVIACLVAGDDFVVIPSNAGRTGAGWWLNLQADPRAEVEFQGDKSVSRARKASPPRRPSSGRACSSSTKGSPTTAR